MQCRAITRAMLLVALEILIFAGPALADTSLHIRCVVATQRLPNGSPTDVCTVDTLIPLNQYIRLQADNLKAWMGGTTGATQNGNDPWKLILFIDDRPLTDLRPTAVDPDKQELIFELARTNATRATWNQLLSRPKTWIFGPFWREARASVGPSGGFAYPSDAKFRFIFLSRGWFVCYLIVLVLAFIVFVQLARRTDMLRDSGSAVGTTRPYSLARSQMAIWSFVVLMSFAFIWICTWDRDTTIPQSVLGLMGVSAVTYVAAALVDEQHAAAAPGGTPASGSTTPPAPVHISFWKDILGDGNSYSLHRVQLVGWTILLLLIFIKTVIDTLAMPDFSAALVGLMGISAGTYVGFKFPEK